MMTKKNQKPIDYDVHFKYLCHKCGQEHWLSLREANTEDYKIVCFCNHVFSVKQISHIKIKYKEDLPTEEKISQPQTIKTQTSTMSTQLYDSAITLLVGYGFTQKEAKEMIKSAYETNPIDDYKILVQNILNSLEINYDS